MNREQMEMLSVKNAIERTITAYVAAYSATSDYKGFFEDLERYVASLFVSRQIDKRWVIKSTSGGVFIEFSVTGHHSHIDYLLPKQLRWKDEQQIQAVQSVASAIAQLPAASQYRTPDVTFEEDVVPLIEDLVSARVDMPNIASVRERLKADIYDQLSRSGLNTVRTYVICDETNNPKEDRDRGIIRVDIETEYPNSPDITISATLTGETQQQPHTPEELNAKTSLKVAFVLSSVYNVLHSLTNNDMEKFDRYEYIYNKLQPVLVDIEDFTLTHEDNEEDDKNTIRFTLSLQLTKGGKWNEYPFFYTIKH